MKLPSFTVNAATLTVICGLFLQGCGILPAKPRQTVKSLAARINARIEKPRFAAASWGIKIVSLDTGRTLFERNPHKFLMPASNTKLYTSALALETLKPTYQMMTEILATAPLDRRGVLTGDLVLYGLGDPTLGAAADTGAQQSPLDALAAQLAGFGLKRVRGSLIIDDSFFATSPIGSGWQADDLQWGYGAEVSALMLHENVFKLTVQPAAVAGQPCQAVPDTALLEGAATPLINLINRTTTTIPGAATGIGIYRKPGDDTFYLFGSLAIDDAPAKVNLALVAPAEAIGKGLLANLKKYHIMVDGGFHVFHWPAHEMFNIPRQWRGLAGLTSPPLAEIVRQTLKRSQNLYAQDLLLQAGRLASENTEARACAKEGPDCTTEQWGIYALNNFLTQAGISTNSVRLQEGSGLARTNLVTPAATTALLQYVSRRPVAQVFQDALPIAGVDGTLEDRMKGTAAENNARAKTGNLQYVYTLSGYVTTAAKEKLAFSIMLNNYQAPEPDSDNPAAAAPKPTDDIDAIVVMLAEFTGHS